MTLKTWHKNIWAKRVFALIIFCVVIFSFSNCEPTNTDEKKITDNSVSVNHILWPGDTLTGITDPDLHPANKINIRGVVKNATSVKNGAPVIFKMPHKPYLYFSVEVGVVPGLVKKPVKFIVRSGNGRKTNDPEDIFESSIDSGTEIEIDPNLPVAWHKVTLSSAGGMITVECDHEGDGAYVGQPHYSERAPLIEEVPPPNVYFVLIDALRADALSAYGAKGFTSTNIDELAQSGTLFKRSYTSSSFTLTSVASIFSGLHPWQHKVMFQENMGIVFSEKVPSLVEEFRQAGYHTAAFSGTYFFMSRNGFAQGFDHFDESCAAAFFRDSAKCLNDRIIPWIEEHKDEPVFVYIHYVDPHAPYYAPEPYLFRYTNNLEKPKHTDVALGEIEQFGKNKRWYQFLRKPSETDLSWLRGLYKGEAAYIDLMVGELLGKIRTSKRGGHPDPIILLTADHGEAFYEHGQMDHVADLHEEVMTVPFIMSGYGVPKGKVIDTQVRTIDYLPTLLSLAIQKEMEGIPGRSISPLFQDKRLLSTPAVAVHHAEGELEYAMVLYPWKLFYRPESDKMFLHRLDMDPDESTDVSQKYPNELKELKAILDNLLLLPAPFEGAPTPMDPLTIKRIGALGY